MRQYNLWVILLPRCIIGRLDSNKLVLDPHTWYAKASHDMRWRLEGCSSFDYRNGCEEGGCAMAFAHCG